MLVKLFRYSANEEDTLGLMYIDGQFACYTLEDQYQNEKIYGETRIPAGSYKMRLRTEGGFHQRYSTRYQGFHIGMLEIADVPGFEFILLHVGNTDDDTAGCILVGNTANNNQDYRGFVGHSSEAYRFVYPKIASALSEGEDVRIIIANMEEL